MLPKLVTLWTSFMLLKQVECFYTMYHPTTERFINGVIRTKTEYCNRHYGNFVQQYFYPRQVIHLYSAMEDEIMHCSSSSSSSSDTLQENKQTSTSSDSTKKRQKMIKPATVKWICCTSTKEVNRAIAIYIQKGDTVAELGSQLRETSTIICETIGQGGKAYLVDIDRKYPKSKLKREERMTAMRREGDEKDFFPGLAKFVTINSFDSWRYALFFNQQMKDLQGWNYGKYNALVIDVSTIAGNDLELTCISLVREFIALTNSVNEGSDSSCRVVIVKSGSLHQLARRLFHAQRLFAGVTSLDDNPHQTSIIGTVGVEEYRRTIPYTVKKGDVVLEVGSHFGTTTVSLHDAAKSESGCGGCLGVDVGVNIIESAKKKFPNVPFAVGDAWKMSELIKMREIFFKDSLLSNAYYDIVYVDVGGLSGSEGLLEALSLLSLVTNCLEPRSIVIKSLCVRRLASSLVSFSQVWKEEKLKK